MCIHIQIHARIEEDAPLALQVCSSVLYPQPNVRAPLTHGMLAMLASPSPNAPVVFFSFSHSYITYTPFSFFTLIQANACDASELHLLLNCPSIIMALISRPGHFPYVVTVERALGSNQPFLLARYRPFFGISSEFSGRRPSLLFDLANMPQFHFNSCHF